MRSLFVAVAALLLAVLVAQAQAGAYDAQELMDDVERLDALSTVQEAHVPTAEELTQRADDAAFLERLATALPVAPAESVPVKSDDTTLLEEEGTVTIAAANSSNPFAYDPLKERRRVCAKARSRYDHKVKAARRDCRKLPKGLKGTPAANKRAACWRSFRRYERRFRNYRARVCKGIWAPSEQKTPCDLARENFSDRVSEAVAACALKQHHDQAVCFRTVGERRKQLWAVVEEACKSKQKVPEFRIRAPSQEEEEEGTTAPVQDDKALDDGEDLRPLLKHARHHEDRLFLMRQIAQAMKTTTDRVSRLRSKAAAAATAESARPRLWRKVAKQVRRLAKLHQRFVELGRESEADARRLAIAERVKVRIAKLKVELKAAAPADRAAIKARLKRLRRKHRRLVRPRDGGRAAAHRRRKRQERRRRQRVQREVRRKQQKALRRARAKKRAAKALKRLNKAMAKAHKKSKAAKSAVNNKVADAKSAAAAFKRAKKAAARAAARRRRQKKRKLKKKKGKRTKLDRKIKTFDLKAAQKDLKTLRKQERIRRKVQRKQRKNKRIYKRFIKKQKRKAQRKRKIRAKIAALKAAGVKSPIGDELDIQMPGVPAAERKKVKTQIRARRVKVAKEIKALQKNYYKQRNAINKKMNKEVEALNERITMADRSGDKKTAKKLTKKAKKLFNKAKKDVKKLRKQVKKQVKAKRRALKRFEKKLIHAAKKAARAANKKKHPKAHPNSKKAPVVAKAAPAAAAPVRK